MNIYYDGGKFARVESAVDHALATGYCGSELEKVQAENEMFRRMLAKLIACVYDPDSIGNKVDQLNWLLGVGYEVIE